MRLDGAGVLLSASDLITSMGCAHATYLDLLHLQGKIPAPTASDPVAELLADKGLEHERAYLARLKAGGETVAEIDRAGPLRRQVAETRRAMAAGADVIYQGALAQGSWHGYADFLVRVPLPSLLGSYSYAVADTKLARAPKPAHVLQLTVYSDLVGHEQARPPQAMHLVLGDGTEQAFFVADFMHYTKAAQRRLEAFVAAPPAHSSPEPCSHCAMCRWRERCEDEWEAADHLSRIAGIRRDQAEKLTAAGYPSMAALAAMPDGVRIPRLQPETLARLRAQATLQVRKREDGQDHYELLPPVPGRGFARLPRPDPGDLFFDMEGDPLQVGGLEYLFGFVNADGTGFTAFWAHDHAEERRAFEQAVDFIMARLATHPGAHVYHYAAYEETALKRLAMRHGTRETAIDHLLRTRKLVDLYKVVRESLRVSEPSYSIKNLEAFYMARRAGGVTTAGDSIVIYERWRRERDEALLDAIARYNETDCRSMALLRQWLLGLRPAGVPWFEAAAAAEADPAREERRSAAEQAAEALKVRLLACSEAERSYRQLVAHLIDFHRREAKPKWWAVFARQDAEEEELVDDVECLGGLRRDPAHPPRPEKRSTVHTFLFPPQDFKFAVGDKALRAETLEPAGEIVRLDEAARRVALKLGPSYTPLPDALSIIPEGPFDDRVMRGAIQRYAEALLAEDGRYAAVTAILRRARPRVRGIPDGAPLAPAGTDLVAATIAAVEGLQESHLVVQGPPGAGKTYTSARAIVALLRAGKRVGVAAHSHKAINRLLEEVDATALREGVHFKGIKKSSTADQFVDARLIANTLDNKAVSGEHQLVAGTAWLFARPEHDQAFNAVVIDEAGQMSLANVVAVGVSARNLVLVGDQMQLAQPIQGVHPDGSGLSALEHVLEGAATVPPERGIFLAETRRMHPDVCRFISEAVYDGRLQAHPSTAVQGVVLRNGHDPALAPAGLRFVAVSHAGCSQRSDEEAERVRQIYADLLTQRWIDQRRAERPIGPDDILVVSPYNMQVNRLREVLPAGARVGTVDKFQGQEAAVVLISMATSSGEDLPRDIGFLFSRNRLNVAISRARALTVIVASLRLLEVPCGTIDEMRLVNAFCWAAAYASN